MGEILDGCACNNCQKQEKKDPETEAEESSESEDDKNLNFLAMSRREIPKNIVDVKFKTDTLVKEYVGNPFDIYKELEELGEGAYGVVKKVCLKDNPDTIRAMKIIPKENIVEGQSQKLLDEIQILRKLEHPNKDGVKIEKTIDDEGKPVVKRTEKTGESIVRKEDDDGLPFFEEYDKNGKEVKKKTGKEIDEDGNLIEKAKDKDGNELIVKKDLAGNNITIKTDKDGNEVTTITSKDGTVTVKITDKEGKVTEKIVDIIR